METKTTPPTYNEVNNNIAEESEYDFTLPRLVMVEKVCPELRILQESLSGMSYMNVECILSGSSIIIYLESPWAGEKLFRDSGITYVMGFIIEKGFAAGVQKQIEQFPAGENMGINLRSLLVLNFKDTIQCLNAVTYTGLYAIPKKGKSIFINTLLKLNKEFKGVSVWSSNGKKINELNSRFNESLPMYKAIGRNCYFNRDEVKKGNLALNIPFPSERELSLYKGQVSLWSMGLKWNVGLINKINEYEPMFVMTDKQKSDVEKIGLTL